HARAARVREKAEALDLDGEFLERPDPLQGFDHLAVPVGLAQKLEREMNPFWPCPVDFVTARWRLGGGRANSSLLPADLSLDFWGQGDGDEGTHVKCIGESVGSQKSGARSQNKGQTASSF